MYLYLYLLRYWRPSQCRIIYCSIGVLGMSDRTILSMLELLHPQTWEVTSTPLISTGALPRVLLFYTLSYISILTFPRKQQKEIKWERNQLRFLRLGNYIVPTWNGRLNCQKTWEAQFTNQKSLHVAIGKKYPTIILEKGWRMSKLKLTPWQLWSLEMKGPPHNQINGKMQKWSTQEPMYTTPTHLSAR